jgi:hypothetical protein
MEKSWRYRPLLRFRSWFDKVLCSSLNEPHGMLAATFDEFLLRRAINEMSDGPFNIEKTTDSSLLQHSDDILSIALSSCITTYIYYPHFSLLPLDDKASIVAPTKTQPTVLLMTREI